MTDHLVAVQPPNRAHRVAAAVRRWPGPLPALARAAIALLLATGAAVATAQDLPPLVVGASLPLSGPNAAAGQEGLKAAQAAFDAANRAGGVQGRKLELKALDDAFDPQRAADNARQLAADGVVALFNCWGTSSCNTVVPVANALRVPLVGGIAGGGVMRAEPGRHAFNVRPTTADEIARMLRQMLTVGQSRIGVVYQDDPFGKSALAAAEAALQKAATQPRITRAVAANGSDAAAAVAELVRADINGLVLLASPVATIRLITALRTSGQTLPVYNLAAQANRRVVSELGANTRAVIFTTLVPSPWRDVVPLVREYQQALQANGAGSEYSYLGLEVFLNARVLIEGLRHAGPKVQRDTLVTALETMGERRFAEGLNVRYGPGDRDGSAYVGLAIIDEARRFRE